MPNWVFNTLVVIGTDPELDAFANAMNEPYTTHYPDLGFVDGKTTSVPDTQIYSNPIFSFRNVIEPPTHNPEFAEEYYAVEAKSKSELSPSDPNWWAGVIENRIRSNHWYDWNLTFWGTKWDIGVADDNKYPNTTMEVTDKGNLLYRFHTAWSPVTEVISTIARQYPNLDFDYEYQEEQGWGGAEYYVAGELVNETHYDIPESHADEIDNQGYCSRCDDRDELVFVDDVTVEHLQDELEYNLYPDCPIYEKTQKLLESLTTPVVD